MSVSTWRQPVLFSLLAVMLLASVLGVAGVRAATGTDVDGVVAVDDSSPTVGATVGVDVTGLDAGLPITLQLCVGTVWETPPGEPLSYTPVFPNGACRELASVVTDVDGAVSAQIDVPTDGILFGGRCSYEPGESSISFGGLATGACTLVATADTDPADGLVPLASTRLTPRLGEGEISGSISDTDGGTLEAGWVTVCDAAVLSDCISADGLGLLTADADSYRLEGLADGRYVVLLTGYVGPGFFTSGSDVRVVEVTGGTAMAADLRVPALSSTSFTSSGADIEVAVAPTGPVPFDATLSVAASGFEPDDVVAIGLCNWRPTVNPSWFTAETQLVDSCAGPEPEVTAIADAAGSIDLELPYTPDRFLGNCRWSTALELGESSPTCYVSVSALTGEQVSLGWTRVEWAAPAGAADVRGVVRADGTTISGASIWHTGPVGPYWRNTDELGAFTVADQPDGPFTTSAGLPGNYYYAGEPVDDGAASFSFGSNTVVVDGVVTDQQDVDLLLDFELLPGGVAGEILAFDGTPVEGYWAYLRSADGQVYLWTYSDAGGSFEFFGLPPGDYQLSAYDWVSGLFAEQVVTVGSERVEGVELRFPRADGSISGAVTTPDGTPLSGAYVSACLNGSETGWWSTCRWAEADPDGTYALASLPAGEWTIWAYSPFNYLSRATATVTLADGEQRGGVDLVTDVATGGVAGRVTDDDGSAVVGADVWICSLSGVGCASATTNSDGDYAVLGAEDGQYTVSVWAPGYVNGSATAQVVDGDVTPGVDVALERVRPVPPQVSVGFIDGDDGGELAGNVFPGQPTALSIDGQCAGAEVSYELRGADGTLWSSGQLLESSAAPGDYAGSIPPQSGRSGRGVLTITVDCPDGEDDPPPIDIDIYIDPSGNVYDTEGQPIEAATVTLYRSDDPAGPYTVVPDGSTIMSPENRTNPDLTDATGYFAWLTVPGYYKVRAEKEGCRAPGDPGTSYVETPPLPVPPEQIGLELFLDCSVAPVDTTPPVVTLDVDDEPNTEGWTARAVPVSVSAVDDQSGVASVTLVVDGVDLGVAETVLENGEYLVAGRAVDGAGNVAETDPVAVKADSGDPEIVITSPTPNQQVAVGEELVAGYACTDEVSGIETCQGGTTMLIADGEPIDTSGPGTRTFAVTATDRAGRTATEVVEFEVIEPEPSPGSSISLAYSGAIDGVWGGDIAADAIRISSDAFGSPARIRVDAQVPSSTDGSARVRMDLRRFLVFNLYSGDVRLADRASGLNQTTPVLFTPIRTGADGSIAGTSRWFIGFFSPYRLDWVVQPAPNAPD